MVNFNKVVGILLPGVNINRNTYVNCPLISEIQGTAFFLVLVKCFSSVKI